LAEFRGAYKVPQKNNSDYENGILPDHITETYLTFGNVHTDSFESFWKAKGKYVERESVAPAGDAKGRILDLIDAYKKLCVAGVINYDCQSLDGFKSFLVDGLDSKPLHGLKGFEDGHFYFYPNKRFTFLDESRLIMITDG
jgi:hypothetical protein